MLGALETAMGKIPSSRMIALGTQPALAGHWFARWLNGDADYRQSHIANPLAPPFQRRTWLKANPSLPYMPGLELTIRKQARKARTSDDALAAFRALWLNLGTAEVQRSELLTAPQWRRCEAEDLPEREGVQVWGIDLGSGAAMSAVSSYWPETGRSETLAAFPEIPDLVERGKRGAVSDLYCKMYVRGELDLAGERIVDISQLLTLAMDRFGPPDAVVDDRWREAELRQALERARSPGAALILRGQGFKDGGADVRSFRRAALDGKIQTPESLLMRSAMAGAVTVSDPAGNAKLAKAKDTPERRDGHRDDACASLILAVAVGYRQVKSQDTQDSLDDDPGYDFI